ncbi:hypothetical protein GCM10010289_85790 [Streptomyces violascens]|nr:hypothetical protein GCM10010289_85790 [Streptomyces violascens]
MPDRWSEDSRGGLKTLQAYAWPMARWMESAAGGTSQRLHPWGDGVRERAGMSRTVQQTDNSWKTASRWRKAREGRRQVSYEPG